MDRHHYDANMDPDPALYLNADPDPAFQFNAGPDPVFHSNADLDPAFHSNADPDPASKNNVKSSADPDPQQHCFQFAKRLRLVTSCTCFVRSWRLRLLGSVKLL